MAEYDRIKAVFFENKGTGKWLAEQLTKSNCAVTKWCKDINYPVLHILAEIVNLLQCNICEQLKNPHNKSSEYLP